MAGFALLFLAGAAVRLADVGRPLQTPDWHEADDAGIARNFYREGMDPLLPRVDWRGDGPGFAESELPLLPWTMALAYRLVGVHEQVGRVVSFAFSLVAMLCFFHLARRRLPPAAALVACAFFLLNPLFLRISTSLQPDGWMFASYLVAVVAFLRWLDGEETKWFLIALAATAAAILAKASAAHLGLLFAFLVLDRWGLKAVRRPALWIFAAGALAPGALWYAHARRLWLTYGNSLGVSNETHWAGLDLFTHTDLVAGVARNELTWVWMPAGAVLIALWLLLGRRLGRHRLELYWLGAIAIFYLVTARTSGDSWASYYHVVAVPPAALLLGAAWSELGSAGPTRRRAWRGAIGLAAVGALAVAAGAMGWVGDGPRDGLKLAILFALGGVLLVGTTLAPRRAEPEAAPLTRRYGAAMALLASLALSAACVSEIQSLYWRLASRAPDPLLACARDFARHVPAGELVVASGGTCTDPTGYPVAYNKPYMLYWMDRKGFNLCQQEQSLPALSALAARGARFFVAEKGDVAVVPGLERALRASLPTVAECGEAWLFALPGR